MSIITVFLLLGALMGFMAVAANPSPYFAAFGLVAVSGLGCSLLAQFGGSFLSLLLFLIYMGAMLVVFIYAVALVAEAYPEGFLSPGVVAYLMLYTWCLTLGTWCLFEDWYAATWFPVDEVEENSVYRADATGASFLFFLGAEVLVVTSFILVISLVSVMEVTRGLGRGSVRAI